MITEEDEEKNTSQVRKVEKGAKEMARVKRIPIVKM
jgi:hypothetical protein